MKLIDLSCPNCKATMQIDDTAKAVFCPYCGSKFAVDDETKHIHYDNAEQAGYEFEKGRQRAQAEQQAYRTYYANPPQPKKKRHTLLWVLGWIFFFPIPLTIIIARSKKLNKTAKIIMISVLWGALLLLGFFGKTDAATASVANTAQIQILV